MGIFNKWDRDSEAFFGRIVTRNRHVFTGTILKTKLNQSKGYQETSGQRVRKWIDQEERSEQQFFYKAQSILLIDFLDGQIKITFDY